jgi:hypothetical protein
VARGLEHAHAAVALEAHDALALEHEQRLADRRPRDPELLGEAGDRVALAGDEAPVDDRRPDRVVGVGGQRLTRREALEAVAGRRAVAGQS